jgi:hypothetical protein
VLNEADGQTEEDKGNCDEEDVEEDGETKGETEGGVEAGQGGDEWGGTTDWVDR